MAPDDSASDRRIKDLEQKYIKLLEARVTELEARISSPAGRNSREVDSDGKPDSDEDAVDARPDVVETDDDDGTPAARYEVVLSEFNPLTGERTDRKGVVDQKAKEDTEKKSKKAFTFRKFLSTRPGGLSQDVITPTHSEVIVHFEPLQRLLGSVMKKYSSLSRITVMTSPYQSLIWSWSSAEAAVRSQGEDDAGDVIQAKADLKELMAIISTSSGSVSLDWYFREKDQILDDKMVSFSSLWTLYPPGTFIVGHPFENEPEIFVVRRADNIFRGPQEDRRLLNLICWNYDWTGSSFNRVSYSITIEHFADKKRISDLSYFPLEFYDDGSKEPHEELKKLGKRSPSEKLKDRLVERGMKFKSYCTKKRGEQTFQYSGLAYHQRASGLFRGQSVLSSSDSDDNNSSAGEPGSGVQDWKFSRLQVNGTVVVDFKSYYEYQPPAAPILGELKRLDGPWQDRYEAEIRHNWDNQDARSDFLRDQALLTPPRVLGYALEQKRWVQLHVERLKNREEASPNIFEQKLQLRQEYKDMIRKTVEAHTRNKEDNINDYTPGKGKGLVIMLWGLPGVGKTLTAESVALLAGKPLFSVGVADIGIDGDRVETNLQKVFDLAGLWEAVLLFDEADVFLEARDSRSSDIRRNTIVSVLLRVLEYYEGILILTTNRLRSFDIAVQSRIHLALEYKDLTEEQRTSIFLEFVSQLEKKGFVSNMKEIKEWIDDEGKSKEFNGRQIRNVVSTAMSLAHADNRLLKKGDLTLVSKHITQFQRALQDQETIYRAAQINKPGG
ncbi:putative ATPase family AAA domain-containing protein 3B [Seiridium cardinale]